MKYWKHVSGVIMAAVIGVVAFVLSDRSPPITVLKSEIDPHFMTAGDCGSVKWTIKVRRVCPLAADMRIETERGNVWPLVSKNVEGYALNGQTLTIAHEFCVPHSLKTADAVFRQTTYYHCWPWNSWWPIVIHMPPTSFHIKGSSD